MGWGGPVFARIRDMRRSGEEKKIRSDASDKGSDEVSDKESDETKKGAGKEKGKETLNKNQALC